MPKWVCIDPVTDPEHEDPLAVEAMDADDAAHMVVCAGDPTFINPPKNWKKGKKQKLRHTDQDGLDFVVIIYGPF